MAQASPESLDHTDRKDFRVTLVPTDPPVQRVRKVLAENMAALEKRGPGVIKVYKASQELQDYRVTLVCLV